MDKLKMHSPNLTQASIARIRELFPGCVVEKQLIKDGIPQFYKPYPDSDEQLPLVELAVDFEQLRQELSDSIVEGPQERYHLNWPGKREALLAANAPIAKTLRPCREESVNFDNTKNLFIEGDNLDALKLLQETYLGKVKMIYIDPPYNTGNDFIYRDDFSENADSFLKKSNQKDAEGNQLVANTEANGRFHSDWLSMIYSRIKLARNLLRDDGVIFISIGDAELHNLKKVCDEILGQENFIVTFSRMMKSGGAKGRFYTPNLDYILAYAKNITETKYFRTPLTNDQIARFYNKTESEGARKGEIYGEERLYKASLDHRPNQRYYIECPDGTFAIPPGVNFPLRVADGEKVKPTSEDGVWKWTYERYKSELDAGNIVFKETNTSALVDPDNKQIKYNIYNKLWLTEQQEKGAVPSNYIQAFENRQSSAELKELSIPFDFAKPVNLIAYLQGIANVKGNEIVLDFFAGSSSTAHSVIKLNSEDGGSRRFVMIQLPESCADESEALKSGYKNIAEISKERIRRAGKKILEGKLNDAWNRDVGFRTLKVDTSNMAEIYYAPDALDKSLMDLMVDNIKIDRTPEDLLFQVMLDWGVDLALPITKQSIQGKDLFFVDGNVLAACFDASGSIDEAFVKELAKRQPLRVVFRDAGFKDDATKINVEQIFKLLSPATEVKCI